MAEKSFGVKDLNIVGATGDPTIESNGDLNLKAGQVAIQTNTTITGVITATSFSGDGTGLTGVTASGTGILVKNSGSTVGTAGTIIFGNNLSVGTLSAGAVTINATSADPGNSDVQVAYTVSGSGVYNFTGNGVDSSTNYPELYMYRDTKYRFIHNAGNSHPIAIFTAQSGGSKYTDGVTYSDTSNNYTTHGNNLDFTPQHDAPDTLWYRCTVHSSMVGKINIVGFDGGSTTRGVVYGTTSSLAQNAIGNITITGHKSYLLMNVGLSTAGWFRLYTDSASRTSDASRSVGEDPAAGSGVIAEVVTTGLSTSIKISPFVAGGNMDSTPSTNMYVAIKNLSSTSQAITANLTILKLED